MPNTKSRQDLEREYYNRATDPAREAPSSRPDFIDGRKTIESDASEQDIAFVSRDGRDLTEEIDGNLYLDVRGLDSLTVRAIIGPNADNTITVYERVTDAVSDEQLAQETVTAGIETTLTGADDADLSGTGWIRVTENAASGSDEQTLTVLVE